MKLLLPKIKNINLQDKEGRTPLHWATLKNAFYALQYLTTRADLKIPTFEDTTPLMSAAEKNLVQVVEYLLTEGAQINAQNKKGQTAVTFALSTVSPDALEKLLLYKPNLNFEDSSKNRFPLNLLVFMHEGSKVENSSFAFSHKQVVEFTKKFKELGADLKNCNAYGQSAYAFANKNVVYKSKEEKMELLNLLKIK